MGGFIYASHINVGSSLRQPPSQNNGYLTRLATVTLMILINDRLMPSAD